MGRFQGLGGIKTNQGGVYFLPGDYTVDIEEVKFFTSRKEKDTFVIQARVLESTNPERAPGCKPSQVIILRPDILATCMGNIKQFAAAILELEDPDAYNAPFTVGTQEDANDQFWNETLEVLVSDDQPAKGIRIKLNITNIKTKEGKDFSKHVWGPVVK